MPTLEQLRSDFELSSNRSLSMPIAGAVVWLVIAITGAIISPTWGRLFLAAATGAIFPIALVIAKLRHEELVSSPNPLAKLMGACIIMVNLLWAVHIPLLIWAPNYLPLSLGIALGLHWVIYSWIIQHNVGITHALLRTALVLAAWLTFPQHQISAVAVAVVIAYVISISQMQSRKINRA